MRQPYPLKRQEPERSEGRSTARFTGQSIDEWLAAAVAEQANRTAARQSAIYGDLPSAPDVPDVALEAEQPAPVESSEPTPVSEPRTPVSAPPRVAPPAPVTSEGDRLTVETAARTAAALGSVTSWIERAQEQLTATNRASSEAQQRTEAVVSQAIGALGKRLEEIERKVDSSETDFFEEGDFISDPVEHTAPDESPAQPSGDGPFKGLESRIRNIAGRVAPAGALGRRGIAARDEVEAAVTEIRTHQARLERGPAADARSDAVRRHPGPMAILRADMDRLARQIEARSPDPDSLDSIKRELEGLRGFVDALATRDQVGTVERGIQELAIDVADVRHRGGDLAALAGHIEGLHSEIQRLADVRAPADQLSKLSRDIDVMSHKLDIVAASGVDPAVLDEVRAEIGEVRGLLAASAGPQDVSILGEQLADIRHDIAKISSRQVDARDFTALRIAFEEVKLALARPSDVAAPAATYEDTQAIFQQIAQDELRPLVGMVADLTRRFERLEEVGSLDGLERQIAALTSVIGQNPGSDPALASLHQGLAELMHEVANWRDSTAEIAERAARAAAQEALAELRGLNPQPAHEVHDERAFERRGHAIDDRADESLETVHTRLEDVVRRIGRLDSHPEPEDRREQHRSSARAPAPSVQPELPEPTPQVRFEPARDLMEEADRPLPVASQARDEVLLEPGAERPRAGSIFTAQPPADSADIKANFIAAARRAAQAAAADAGRGKGTRFSDAVESAAAGESDVPLKARVGAAIDRFRRPLLIGAAVIAVAIGGLRLANELSGANQNKVASRQDTGASAPVIAAQSPSRLPPAPATRSDSPEPQTTQGLSPTQRVVQQAQPIAATQPAETTDGKDLPQASSELTPASPSAAVPAESQKPAASAEPAASKPKVEASLGSPNQPLQAPSAAPDAGPAAALNALKQAANSGDAVALYELGARTSDGRGVAKDPRAAAQLFERAAEKGLTPAQYRTGNLYEKGIGVARDIEAAKKWYQRAAENGNTRAMHNLAVLIAEGGAGRPDYAAALTWFQRAADYGVRDSQFNLAVLSARGLGGPQDLVKSFTWFSIAAVQGDEEAGRKRDEVASRLSPTDLAKAKAAAERWKPVTANPAANEVQLPAGGWTSTDASNGPNKRTTR